jgi:hypothetical protein
MFSESKKREGSDVKKKEKCQKNLGKTIEN